MTNAERQARWRAKRQTELEALRNATTAAKPAFNFEGVMQAAGLNDKAQKEVFQAFKKHVTALKRKAQRDAAYLAEVARKKALIPLGRKLAKLQATAERPGSPTEGEAARAAIERMGGVNREAIRQYEAEQDTKRFFANLGKMADMTPEARKINQEMAENRRMARRAKEAAERAKKTTEKRRQGWISY